MSVNDHGLEVLKKAGGEVVAGDKSEYYILVKRMEDSSDMPNVLGYPTPIEVTAAYGLQVTGTYYRNAVYVVSNGGAVTVVANPQIVVPANFPVGSLIELEGTSDTDYPIFSHGNGLILNGPCNLKSGSTLVLRYNGTSLVEVGRNDIA